MCKSFLHPLSNFLLEAFGIFGHYILVRRQLQRVVFFEAINPLYLRQNVVNMKIANPIYDVVFKYLMDDNKIAKLMISKIIGEEIESLYFQPKDNVVKIERSGIDEEKPQASFTVYRLDFAARIKLSDGGYKQVLIEIQKAKLPTDIMRFRKYLGQQYLTNKNSIDKEVKGELRKTALPIVAIYFLGHPLDFETAPVIKVNRNYVDLATGEQLKNKEEFIESLTHDSYVIQIPELKGKRRTELEKMLSIFDQSQKESDHILNISETDFPEEYRDIIRKLQSAITDEEIQNTMDVEDEILSVLEVKERRIEDMKESLTKMGKELDEKDKLIEELKRKLGEK
jgi:hypothetical protein